MSRLLDKARYGIRSFLSAKRFDSASVATGALSGAPIGNLKGKTLFITGASRGIGLEIALKAAADGANIVIAAKTADAHPKLPGTIYSAAEAVEKAGGKALAIQLDVRDAALVQKAVDSAAAHFGGIDILVNNASAIYLEKTPHVTAKQYDLMQQVNVRGTFFTSQACYPYLKKAKNPHVLVLSPPINLQPPWLGDHLAYTLSKYGMSMCVLGLAQEWASEGIAVNGLWPRTTIATAAIQHMPMGDFLMNRSRKPQIMADAAYQIFIRDSRGNTGKLLMDDEVLASAGITDLEQYSVQPGSKLQPDLFI